MSRRDLTDGTGVYTIEGLPAGNYRLEVDYPGYQKEYYNNAYDKAAATPVQGAAGETTSNINFSLETKFTIDGSIQNSRNADGSFQTVIEVIPWGDFPGTLPGDITSITVTGPGGIIASYPGAGWEYLPQWADFTIALSGSPQPGLYTFTARSAKAVGIDVDHQYIIRTLPFFDESKISPADGVFLTFQDSLIHPVLPPALHSFLLLAS